MLSDKYKCIYVHIPKVAGQSIEHFFLKLHGLTWETRDSLLLRQNDDPAKGPPRLGHLKASEYLSYGYVTPEQFTDYFKFAFVRNPWSRLVSFYIYLNYVEKVPFKKFVQRDFIEYEWHDNRWFVGPQADYVLDENDNQIVDFVGKFENLQSGFDHVCTRLALGQHTLPFVNKTKKNKTAFQAFKESVKRHMPFYPYYEKKGGYKNYYDTKTVKAVAKLYEKDIDLFKYTFEE